MEVALQQERERLTNMMMITRGIVHDLKTPIHQRILEAGHQSRTSPLNSEQREYLNEEIRQLDLLMKQVNEILDLVNMDANMLTELVEKFDLVELFEEIRDSFKLYLEKSELWLNAEMPLKLETKFNRITARLIIHNMLSNVIKYATPQSEVIFLMYAENGKLIFKCTNEATDANIERIKKSEQLFNAVLDKSQDEKDEYVYSTGNGLYLIKNLALMNNGVYDTIIENNKITISVEINGVGAFEEQ